MDNSLLVSLSQQLAAYRAMDVIANNLANVSTPGFKRETAKFEEYVSRMRPAEGQTGTQAVSFVKDAGISRDISAGSITNTGATYDMAISGKGYFAVQTPQGMRYTRDGHFTLNQNGNIVNSDGYALQGDSGALTVTPDDGEVQIAPDGTMSSILNGNTNLLGKVKLVDFNNPRTLTKEGANLYTTTQAENPADGTLKQGALESSNVQPVIEISHMIEVMRAYEATATMSKSQQDMQTQALDKLGSMPN